MLLLAIFGYYKLFHFKLFLSIINYFTLDYFSNPNIWLLVLLMVISTYFIGGY